MLVIHSSQFFTEGVLVKSMSRNSRIPPRTPIRIGRELAEPNEAPINEGFVRALLRGFFGCIRQLRLGRRRRK